jgi:hypothetical protein
MAFISFERSIKTAECAGGWFTVKLKILSAFWTSTAATRRFAENRAKICNS